jgi:nitroreductase
MSAENAGARSTSERVFPSAGGAAERLRFLLQWAVLAPSRHNTQPWIFEIEGDELRVHVDGTRRLPAADPDGRQLVMACGAAMLNLRLAAAHFGHATSVELLGPARRDGLLARVRLEERSASTPQVEEMFRAIPARRTNRLPLDGREPPAGLVTALLREARREGAWLRPVDEVERRAVAEIVAQAGAEAWASSRYRAELAGWTRSNATSRRDGVPGWAHGMSDAAALLRPVLVRLTNPSRHEADRDRRRVLSARALLVLSTPRDGLEEWARAGEALQRVLLRATAAGLCASYFSQPVEIPALRRRLGEVLGDRGVPQIVFRLGYGLEPRATPRRPVHEVLRKMVAERTAGAALLRLPGEERPRAAERRGERLQARERLQAPGSRPQATPMPLVPPELEPLPPVDDLPLPPPDAWETPEIRAPR